MSDQALSLAQLNRTFIGSVLFIDIVGYSRGTVPEQIAMKDVFNALLTEAVVNVAPSDRIMVDTGDGAGVAFLGDPEDALFAALSLRDAIDAGKVTMGEKGFVRMGINLGPLKMVRDINGHTNMIGDAVNDAQRVMSFAEPGQVMVSHSYYDIISRFSTDYAKLFSYEGARHDKHVREHQVYSFGPNVGTEVLTEKLRDRSRARNPNSIMPMHFENSEPVPEHAADEPAATAPSAPIAAAPAPVPVAPIKKPAKPASASKKGAPISIGMIASIGLLIAGVFAGVATWYLHSKATVATTTATATVPANAAKIAPVPPAAVGNKVAAATPSAAVKAASASMAASASVSAPVLPAASAPPANDKAASAVATTAAASSAASAASVPSVDINAKPGTVLLSIEPWGEVFVDGTSSGTSPPLKSLKLPPGKHKIEVRNSDFAPFKKTIQVKSDTDIAVHYAF